MKYELNLLEKWIANPVACDVNTELVRIRAIFMEMALSHKKLNYLERYFRFHRDALVTIIRKLQEKPLTRKNKQALAVTSELAVWMNGHLEQYLSAKQEAVDPDDPDIDAQKVITTFTLPKLGVIIRLFIETGVFRVRNRKALTRFMSRNVAIRTRQVPERFQRTIYTMQCTPSSPGDEPAAGRTE